MPARSPEPPKGGPGQNDPKKNPSSAAGPGSPPAARGPALVGLASDDDEDDAPKPPRPVRMTSQMKAVTIPAPSAGKPAAPPAPAQKPAPPGPPAPKPAPPAHKPAPPAQKPAPAPAPSLGEDLGEATVMMASPMNAMLNASQPAVGESTIAVDPGMMSYTSETKKPAAQPAPAPKPLPVLPPTGGGLYGADNESTRVLNLGSEAAAAAAAPQPNNESTRIFDGPSPFAGLTPMRAGGGLPGMSMPGVREPAGGGGGSGSGESTMMADSTAFREATQYGEGGKRGRKPVADVKARSKLKVAPLDPQRLLVQQEAAERKAQENSGIGNIDKFLERSGLMKVPGDEMPAEHTIVGKFLGFVGLGEKSGIMAAPVGKDPAEEAWDAVKSAPLLNGLNPQFINDAIKSGDLKLVSLGRDMLVDIEGRAVLLLEGQLAMARFKGDILDRERRAQAQYKAGDKKAEKREHKRRQEVGPLIRMCESNLGLFNEGDLVSIEAQGEEAVGLALYSVTPIRALSITRARLDSWRRTYQFFGERLRRAADAARNRLAANTGARALVADFFVRHGLSVAMSLRVRELDKCIECYECEKACEERYGVKRLSLNGKVLGALDFVDCCHTCVDQRCIDPCAYDAIKFDVEKKEVLILEDACIGCSLCALACPYDAIEMHELDDKPLLQLRLQKESKLGFGEGKPRKAKLRRIASKCDHCVSYEDQACISACPTTALLEIPPEAAFTERTDSMADAAKGGFDRTVMFDPNELFDPKKFYKGLAAEDDKGKRSEKRLRTGWLWALGLIPTLLALAEIALRKYLPEYSLQFLYETQYAPEDVRLDPDMALANVEFRPGGTFALWLGWVGTVIMFSSTSYSARKWLPFMKKAGGQRSWFDYHVWAGTIGPLLVMMHTAAKLDNWVSLAIWAMVATVLSGLVGRYLSTELPDLASQASLQVMDYERKMAEMRNRHAGVNVADRFYDRLRKRYARVTSPNIGGFRAGVMALQMMFTDSIARTIRGPLLRFRLQGIKDKKARTQVANLATSLALFERRRVLLPKIEPMFREWKIIHIPFSIVLVVLATIHIVIELTR